MEFIGPEPVHVGLFNVKRIGPRNTVFSYLCRQRKTWSVRDIFSVQELELKQLLQIKYFWFFQMQDGFDI